MITLSPPPKPSRLLLASFADFTFFEDILRRDREESPESSFRLVEKKKEISIKLIDFTFLLFCN